LLALSFIPIQASSEDLTILFTHDMHDNLDAYTMLEDGEIHSRGGFERLATAINIERQKDPDLLLLDAGDYSMGTLYQSIYETHSPALRLMTQLNYDATTFGNHEFDFRTQGLVNSLNTAKKHLAYPVPIIATNTKFPEDKNLDDLKDAFENYGVIDDYLMVNKKGVNIAIIGLMGEEADTYAPMAEVEFSNYIEEAKDVVKKIQENENADMIIALSHSGTDDNPKKSEDELLAQAVPELDVIISGHSHTTLDEPRVHGSTIVVSSGRYTENIGSLKLSKDQDRWKLVDYEIVPLKDNFEKDIAMTQELEYYKDAVEDAYLNAYGLGYDDVLAQSKHNFTPAKDLGEEHVEEPLGYLIADAYKYATYQIEGDDNPVDVAVVPYGVIRDSITQGLITTKDAFKISSLGIGKDGLSGYPLISVYISGKELKTAAEVDASIQPMQKVAQLYMSGLSYEFNPNRLIFNKVTDVKLIQDNEKIELEDDKLYRVVANLYTAQMLGLIEDQSKGLLSVTPLDVNGNVISDFEEHIIYDENGNELKEWIALANYLQSFDKEDGVSTIDEKYYTTHGYKVINDDHSLFAKLKQPNKIALMIYAIIMVVLLLILLLIRFIVRKVRKQKRAL
ncbi:MAG TPA: bifunctional UDP-sugar hydrolase/5'-nucleotidase, partial [Erysipelothrix sp.]|nr:bifunctional UDP-sugar hydrolase/5'-nucleotidase [Erysipelothrix sp.]